MNDAQLRANILREAVEKSASDPHYFCRFFLRHWFPSDMPPFHMGLLALMTKKVEWLNDYPECHDFLLTYFKYSADPNDPTSVQLNVFELNSEGKIVMVCGDHLNEIIPRGFSKTTLCTAFSLYEAVTDGTTFEVYISKASEHAETQLGNIRIELETNNLLREAYGDVVPTRADVEKWQSDQLQLRNGAILVARGRGGQVRGLVYRARRPNLIVLDDVEDEDSVATANLRLKTSNWFYSSVEKAGQLMEGAEGEDWAQQPLRIINLATLLGPDALAMTLAKDPKFNTVKFGAKLHDDLDDERMLWPYKLSYKTYMAERKRHQRVGKLGAFSLEMDSSIRVSDDTIFPGIFIYEPITRAQMVHVGQALDPAISDQPGRDHAALVVVGRREKDGLLWQLDEWGGLGKTPREKVDAFFEHHVKWKTTHNGIESQQYQAALIFLMREEMIKRRYFFAITPIVQGSDVRKDDRIVGVLSPRYMNGMIRHLRPLPNLEGNLGDWPNGKKDYADASSMAMTLMGESAGLVIPTEERNIGDYAPLPNILPPVFQTASNHIIRDGGASSRFARRYPR